MVTGALLLLLALILKEFIEVMKLFGLKAKKLRKKPRTKSIYLLKISRKICFQKWLLFSQIRLGFQILVCRAKRLER